MGRVTASRAAGVLCVAAAVLLPLAGCGDTECDDGDGEFRYPLEVGNRWEYRHELHLSVTPIAPLGEPARIDTATFLSECSIEVARIDSLSSSVDAYVLHQVVEQDSTTFNSEQWYTNEPDGLYMHAYRPGASFVAPKATRGSAVIVGGVSFADIRDVPGFVEGARSSPAWDPDSLILEDPPLCALPYPPLVGYEWMCRPPGSPWHIDKRIVGTARVAAPAGTFECYVIQWLVDFHEDGQWDDDLVMFDYVASEGLVRRSFYTWGWMTDEHGDTLGFLQSREESELTSLRLGGD